MRWQKAILTGLVICQLSLTSCGVKYAYIPSHNQVVFPSKGDVVPEDGLCLITKGHYVSLHEQANENVVKLPLSLGDN